MAREGTSVAWLRFLRNVLLIDLAALVLVGALCWIAGWRTAECYSTGAMLAGMLLIAIGGYSVVGNLGAGRTIEQEYGQTAGRATASERARQLVKDASQSYAFFALMGVAGLVAILLGQLIRVIYR